jgi:hypothetical protein
MNTNVVTFPNVLERRVVTAAKQARLELHRILDEILNDSVHAHPRVRKNVEYFGQAMQSCVESNRRLKSGGKR